MCSETEGKGMVLMEDVWWINDRLLLTILFHPELWCFPTIYYGPFFPFLKSVDPFILSRSYACCGCFLSHTCTIYLRSINNRIFSHVTHLHLLFSCFTFLLLGRVGRVPHFKCCSIDEKIVNFSFLRPGMWVKYYSKSHSFSYSYFRCTFVTQSWSNFPSPNISLSTC